MFEESDNFGHCSAPATRAAYKNKVRPDKKRGAFYAKHMFLPRLPRPLHCAKDFLRKA